MINVSSEFKRLLYSGEGNFIVDATITLSNNTVLNVSNSRIMSNGLEIDDAVGSDDDFNCIGSTIVNGCELILYNNDEIYSDYDFINAKVNIVVKLMTSNGYEPVQKGTYTVDAATFSDVSVTLTLLDNMCQFDRPYDSYNIYDSNTTIYDVVLDACTKCGVLPAPSMTNMPNKTFVVAGKPKDNTTYREVIGWCAAIAGCFASCTTDGKLEFSWFNTAAFDLDEGTDGGVFDSNTPYYSTGDTLNGGTFNPWNDPTNTDGGLFTDRSGIHHISALMSQNIGVDDVVITAVQIAYDVETDNKVETKYYPTTIANNNDVISIASIPFINADNVASFYNTLSAKLIGLSFRTCNVTQTHDPTIEAGDIAWLWDTKGEKHRVLITRTTFAVAGLQTIVCGAKTPARNSATQMTALAKAEARSNRRLNEEKSIRQQLEADFNQRIANSSGLYLSEITDSSTGARIIYGHDKPLLAESTMVLKLNNGAIAMTADYSGDDATTTWYGFQFDGTWLANIISTVNLFFDYAHGGTLKLGGVSNGNGNLKLYNSSGNQIGSFDNTGLKLYNKYYQEGVTGQYEVRLQSGRLRFYYENVYVGSFTSSYLHGDVNKRGISLDLSETGDYIAWSVYDPDIQLNVFKLVYLKDADSINLANGLADTIRLLCDFDVGGYRIVDPLWKFRSSNGGTYSYENHSGVTGPISVTSADGGPNMLLRFKRGILVDYEFIV